MSFVKSRSCHTDDAMLEGGARIPDRNERHSFNMDPRVDQQKERRWIR